MDVDFPDTPAGARAAWYLGQMQAHGAGLTEDEVLEHMALAPPWQPGWAIARFREDDGRPWTVAKVSSPAAEEIALIFDFGDDKPQRLLLTIDTTAPHKIVRTWWGRAAPEDIVIRLADERDAEALNALEIRAPMTLGENTTLIYDRGADFLGFSRLMEENVCFVAEREGELLGIACGAAHDVRIGGRQHRVMLLHHLRVPVEHRKLGVFSTLNGYVFGAYDGRTDGAYGYTAVDNAEAMRIGGPGTWDAPVYRAVVDCRSLAAEGEASRATPADAEHIVDVLNRCHDGEEVYLPYTVDSLTARLERAPDLYSWPQILLGDGAVLGIWPAGLLVTIDDGTGPRQATRAVVLDHGFDSVEAFERLFRQACHELLAQGHDEVTFLTSEGSPAYPMVSTLATRLDLYAFRMAIPEPEGTRARGVYVDAVYF